MPKTVGIREAKTHLSRLLRRVSKGEEIVLVKRGEPVARLVPLNNRDRKLGFVAGTVPEAFFEPLPDEVLDRWSEKGDPQAFG